MPDKNILIKYIFNGFLATAIHFSVLTFNLNILHFQSAAAANMVASIASIFISYIGNRFYVFNITNYPVLEQLTKFFGMYWLIACLHGLVLYIWSDWLKFDYRIGFILAVCIQFFFGYIGNKKVIFRP